MNYLRGFSSVLGSPSAGNQPSPHETIERLCDRVASSTLLEDRRDAVRALKSLSKKYRLEVGTQGMDLLINVLQTDRSDTEIVGMALESLCNIMSTDTQSQEPGDASDSEVGLQFTEIFIKKPDNVTLLLGILEEYEFHVRWPTVKLLTMLLTNKGNLLQQCILVSPMGVSRLMDLLSDSREIIRNEGLLLLIQLTKSNAAIQKIVAFENAFDRLMEIIAEEGYSDGGVVVEDCLLLLQHLLKANVSNQNFFREGSFIQRINPFFEMSALAEGTEENGWGDQKVSNVQLMLQVVRILVSPDNPQQASTSAQKIMNHCGLLKLLCSVLMASGIPADILTETINAVSEVIRGFPANQDYFSQVNAPSEPPRPAIIVLLMSMINDKQPASLRCAVLYCFQCYLHKNEGGQSEIVSTLLPSSADVASSVSTGQLLCAGLFSPDPLSNWCAAVALAHCLKGNQTQKEQLLRVQLATSVGNPPVSLLQQCTNMLAQGSDTQTRVGIVVLLCSWLYNCPIAVAHFLHNPANVPYLMAQVESHGEEGEVLVGYLCSLLLGLCLAFNDDSVQTCKRDDLRALINKRIGLENLLEKVSNISKSEYFTAAVKSPEIKVDVSHHVLFDHEFTRLFKKLDAAVSKAVEETPESAPAQSKKTADLDNHDSIVASYKELIREQDEEIGRLKSRCSELESSYMQSQSLLEQQSHEIFELRHQIAGRQDPHQPSVPSPRTSDGSEVLELRNQVNNLHISQRSLEQLLQEKQVHVQNLEKDLEISQAQLAVATAAAELADSSESSSAGDGSGQLNSNQLEDLAGLCRTVTKLQAEVETLRTQNAALQQQNVPLQVSQSPGTQAAVEAARQELASHIRDLEERLAAVQEEKELQTQEHEDLLVMLADQAEKIVQYKKTLRDAGHEVSDDEDEEGDDHEEGDEEDDDGEEEDAQDEVDEPQQQQQQQQEDQPKVVTQTQSLEETPPAPQPEDHTQEPELPSQDDNYPAHNADYKSQETGYVSQDGTYPSSQTDFPSYGGSFPANSAEYSSYGAGDHTHGSGYPVNGTEYPPQDSGYDTGYPLQDTGYQSHDTGYQSYDTGYPLHDTGYPSQYGDYPSQYADYQSPYSTYDPSQTTPQEYYRPDQGYPGGQDIMQGIGIKQDPGLADAGINYGDDDNDLT